MKKLRGIIYICMYTSFTVGQPLTTDLNFFSPAFFSIQADYSLKNNVLIDNTTPLLCIIIGEPLKNESIKENKELISLLYTFSNKLIIPSNYEIIPSNIPPSFIFFNWDDKDNLKKQKTYATELASGIKAFINQYPDTTCIIIGYGQANTIINQATQQLSCSKKTNKKPISLLIQLAPHILPGNVPNTDNIKTTITFYSKKETPLRSDEKYEKFYPQKHFPLIMNVLLLINNKHPEEDAMLSPFVAKHLFTMCQELSKGCSFFMITEMNKKGIVFHHRFHLSTMRENTHMKLLALPIDTTDEAAIKEALKMIDTKNDLLNKCVCTMKKDEDEHKKSWGNYPESVKTISQYQKPKVSKKLAAGKKSTTPYFETSPKATVKL